MCRNIRQLHNFEPAATDDEIRASALQYVRKVSGTTKPSKANEEAFNRAVDRVAHVTAHLLDELITTAPPKDREVEAAKRRARAQQRYAACLRASSGQLSTLWFVQLSNRFAGLAGWARGRPRPLRDAGPRRDADAQPARPAQHDRAGDDGGVRRRD